ncbi:MAG: ABC transporter permease, partial [Actinobacteria bacterium]|nr:ABC transporter permease [Actinomycetota bacterium]
MSSQATIEPSTEPHPIDPKSVGLRTVSLRNLGAHQVRLIPTVVAVVLGTAFIAGSFVFTDTLKRTFDTLITTSDQGLDVRVQPVKDTSAGVPVSLVSQLQGVDGVRAVEPVVSGQVVVVGPNDKRLKSGGAPTEGSAYIPPDQAITTPITFVAGSAPSAADQVVINQGAAKNGKLKVGDQLRIIFPAGPPMTVTLSGIYHTSVDTGGYVGVLFTQDEALKSFSDGSHVDAINIAAVQGVSQQSLRAAIAKQLPAGLEAKTGEQVRKDDQSSLQHALSFINYFLLGFGAIALLVGTFIIYNTFSMIVAQRLRELALLRAIGADRKQIRRSVVFEAAVIGLIGSIVGVGGG